MSVVTDTVRSVPADPTNYHDAFFREVMSIPVNAASELRAVLPETLAAQVDWDHLELQSTSFVTSELRPRYGDLLFRTRIGSHPAYIYLLVEHQSSPDPLMAFRILEYMVSVWNHHIGHHPKTRTLPAVVPLVVYQSPSGRRWTAPLDIAELIDLDEATREAAGAYIPRLRYILDNVTLTDIPSLFERELTTLTRIMLTALKTAPGNTDMFVVLEMLREDFEDILSRPGGVRDMQLVLTYIMSVGETDPADIEKFADQLGPRAKEAFVTTAERLSAEAEARGEARGEVRGRVAVLLEQLTAKFGHVPQHLVDTLRAGNIEQLQAWSARVLEAERIDQVFC